MRTFFMLGALACGAFMLLVLRAAVATLRERAWLPVQLRGSELLYSERLFRSRAAMPIVARIDRGYLVAGQLQLVELKRRAGVKVYEMDVIELSAQRVAVQASTAIKVGSAGIVVVEDIDTGRRTARKVELLSEERVAELLRRRLAILDGFERPNETTVAARCAACEYRSECKGEASARVHPLVRR